MSREDILSKIQDFKNRIFVLKNDAYESITLINWKNKENFYPEWHPGSHPGGNDTYKELNKWYKVIGGRYRGSWVGKQLIKSLLTEHVEEKYIAAVDIDTSMMLTNIIHSFYDEEGFGYYYPYEESETCKIKVTFFTTIDDESFRKIDDFEVIDDITNYLQEIFVMTKDQISIEFSKRNPEERFQHLLEKRKNNVIKTLKSLKRLSNKKNYNITSELSKQEIESSISEINRELMEVKRKFLEKDDKGLFSSQEEVNEKEFKLVFDLQNDSIQALKKTIKDLEKELNIIKGHEKPF